MTTLPSVISRIRRWLGRAWVYFRSMKPTSGRLVFNIGEAFPADSPVAVFLVVVSTALNDLLTVTKWLVGGDQDQPFQNDVSDVEHLYLLRLSSAHLQELRRSIRVARNDADVEEFVSSLPESTRWHLHVLQNVNTDDDGWVEAAMRYARNQTFHYGGRWDREEDDWSWDDQKWALGVVADKEGEIEMVNEKLVGMRLKFADEVAIQHLARKFPEYDDDPQADIDRETIEERLSTLIQPMRRATSAALSFTTEAVNVYLDTLPEDVVRVET